MEYIEVPIMSECFAKGQKPEYLFWVGCLGSFDDRAKKISKAFARILHYAKVDYAILGKDESCCGDPVRRAGNEMLYQMQAFTNIEILKMYEVKKIITFCPHCFNTFKNEYTDFEGEYEVIHSTDFLLQLINEGKLKLNTQAFENEKIAYHDPCYLGRANNMYESSRILLDMITNKRVELKRCKSFALCCGAGGAQMFKEAEKGNKEVFIERIEDVIESESKVLATACPYCMVMLTDGIKYKNKEEDISNFDIIELISKYIQID